jgi:hypothetical protein
MPDTINWKGTQMKNLIFVLMSLLIAHPAAADWSTPVQVNPTGTADCKNPSMDIGTDGSVHVVWVRNDGNDHYESHYRARNNTGWSDGSITVCDDNGLIRNSNWHRGVIQGPHVAVNPENIASAVFFHRNKYFYYGTEQAAVFYRHELDPWGEEESVNTHLHCISGMAEHVIHPFIIYNPYTTVGGEPINDFMVFWSQHEKMNDSDHDIYYNYRFADSEYVDPGWQYVLKTGDSDGNKAEFLPFVTLNSSDDEDFRGDIYTVSYEFGHGFLLFGRYSNNDNEWKAVQDVDLTTGSCGASVGYYFEESQPGVYVHYIVVACIIHKTNPESHKLVVVESIDNGLTWTDDNMPDPVDIHEGFNKTRPVMDIDLDGNIYIVFVNTNGKVSVLKRVNENWSIMNDIPQTLGYLRSNVYLKLDPNDNGDIHVVYDEQNTDNWNVKSTKWSEE